MILDEAATRGKSKTSSKKQAACDLEVSILENSVYYFLSHVFIMKKSGMYWIVVLRDNRLLTYCSYKTARGAKIAFSKLYESGWKENVKAKWGPFFNPDNHWLGERLKKVKTIH
jgi:hypothetical protein